MERSTIIASVIAGAGILIAGSVAGTAAINAAASSEPDPSSSQLLAAPAVIAPAPVADVAPLPSFTTEPLPEITEPSAATRPAKASDAATREAEAPAATPDSVPVAQATLPPEQAVALVLAATGGGSTQDVRQVTRAGYEAWAVTVQRPDGSIVTGFVDRASANVFDWRVVQAAPVTVAYTDDEEGEYEEDDHGDEHEKSEKDDHDEHEGDHDDD